ncbi:unnamed protein product [Rotaria sordida]|uniref:NHL repeat containing protein n=1 Tax=Rotaria sordida TaxID=392033 RepID=A0A819I2B2_9BILA|nr:unnamed protein product [Rotaria sordida]CAF3909993.1 unnamed protein product [Rotaria sordida]
MSGEAADRFDRPFSVVLDSSNTLYISDQNNNRVQKWLAGASTGTTVAGQASTVAGMDSNSLDNPSGVLLDSSGNIYVADTNNFRIQYWPQGASSGTTIAGITAGASSGTVAAGGNGLGTSNTQLKYPVGVYFDASSNSLIIANTGANNIVRWVLGASSWTLIAGSISGARGNNATFLNYPVTKLLTLHKSMDDFDNQVTLALIKGVSDLLKEQRLGSTIDQTKIDYEQRESFNLLYAFSFEYPYFLSTVSLDQLDIPYELLLDRFSLV